MIREYNMESVEHNFVDEDGWLTYALSEGGKKRLNFSVTCHGYRRPPKSGNLPTSNEIFEKLMEHPEEISVVLSDAPEKNERYYRNSEPYACVLASTCDAAGLIAKDRVIICLTLEDCKFPVSSDGGYIGYGWGNRTKYDLYGSTAQKHDKIARELIEAGAELVVAPVGWDGPEPICHITGWSDTSYARDFAFVKHPKRSPTHAYSRFVPIIDADTPVLHKAAGAFGGDEAEQARKTALTYSKEIFKGLELDVAQAVSLLSYDFIKLEETKTRSYKVPIWKKELIRPTVEHFPEFNGGQGKDDVAEKLMSCRRIWGASLDAYGVSFKKGTESTDAIVRAWKEIGSAMGVDSSIEAVLVCGVPVDDVIASI